MMSLAQRPEDAKFSESISSYLGESSLRTMPHTDYSKDVFKRHHMHEILPLSSDYSYK